MHFSTVKSRKLRFAILCMLKFLSAVYGTKYVTRPGTKLLSQYVTDTRNVSSAMACAVACTSESACWSVSWSASDHQCVLSNIEVAFQWPMVAGHPALQNDTGWTTYGEIYYPVAAFRKQRYSLTWAEAKQLCEDQGTELATQAQLLEARDMGLHWCMCGWFADESNGFVLQYYDPMCWHTYNTGILYCGHALADAWCVMK